LLTYDVRFETLLNVKQQQKSFHSIRYHLLV